MRFFCYDLAKLAICVNTEDPTIFERFMAGAMAGVTSQTIIYPLEIASEPPPYISSVYIYIVDY